MSFTKFILDDIEELSQHDLTTLKVDTRAKEIDVGKNQDNSTKSKRKRQNLKEEISDSIYEDGEFIPDVKETQNSKRKRLQLNKSDDEVNMKNESNEAEIKTKKQRPFKPVDLRRRKPKEAENEYLNETYGLYINKSVQTTVRHTLLPEFNKGKCTLESIEDFSYNIYPHCVMSELRPIYITKKEIDNLETCFGRTIQHAFYKMRLSNARTRYQTAWKSDRTLRKLEKKSIYHTSLFTFAERLESNPDPFFYGNYDFYYTGGNLCVLPTATHNVVHVDGSDFSTFKISTCLTNDDPTLSSLQECITTKLQTDSEIFEISSLKNINDKENLFTVRQRNNVTIFTIDPLQNEIKSLVEMKTKFVPFISLAQSLEKPEMLVLSTMKQKLQLYNVNCMKNVINENSFKMGNESSTSAISFNRILPLYGQTFVYANERQMSLVDFRTSQKEWLKTECGFSTKEFPCETNSSLAASDFDNLFYVGTTHKLLCIDTRYLNQRKNFFENVAVCEWTHELDYSPAFLNVISEKNCEYIACASPVSGDVRICELTNTKYFQTDNNKLQAKNCSFESYCLPWQPPTLQEAYENACLTGKVLQPETNLQQRIRACTTGTAFLKTNNFTAAQAFFLNVNSKGDVYAQTMQFGQKAEYHQRTSEQSDKLMEDYAAELCKLSQPNLNYTDIVDMKESINFKKRNIYFSTSDILDHKFALFFIGFRNVLLCPNLRGKLIKTEKDVDNEVKEKPENLTLKTTFKGRWQKSISTLHTYKDALAKDLLSIWDIPYEDEVDIKYSELKKKFSSEKSESDILNWLNKNDEPAPTTSIPISNLTTIEMEESTSNINLDSTNISALLNESTIENTTWTPAKPKIAKPKKKHIKGF